MISTCPLRLQTVLSSTVKTFWACTSITFTFFKTVIYVYYCTNLLLVYRILVNISTYTKIHIKKGWDKEDINTILKIVILLSVHKIFSSCTPLWRPLVSVWNYFNLSRSVVLVPAISPESVLPSRLCSGVKLLLVSIHLVTSEPAFT